MALCCDAIMSDNEKNLLPEWCWELIRQSAGDRIEGKTRLFKAFYFAHLFYARSAVDYLTDWPIVRMPQGPGIDPVRRSDSRPA